MQALGAAAESGAMWALGGFSAAVLDRANRRRWMVAGSVGPAAMVVNYAIKQLVRRARPEVETHLPLASVRHGSFPSAHATSSFAAATAMGRVAPRANGPLLALAALVAIGRPYLGVHYPSDVVFGAWLGVTIGRRVPLELRPVAP
jgi:membrane-associated phospholipid phosphatase